MKSTQRGVLLPGQKSAQFGFGVVDQLAADVRVCLTRFAPCPGEGFLSARRPCGCGVAAGIFGRVIVLSPWRHRFAGSPTPSEDNEKGQADQQHDKAGDGEVQPGRLGGRAEHQGRRPGSREGDGGSGASFDQPAAQGDLGVPGAGRYLLVQRDRDGLRGTDRQ